MAPKKSRRSAKDSPTLAETLRLQPGPVDLAALDSHATPGFAGSSKDDAPALLDRIGVELADRRDCLFANGRSDDIGHRVLARRYSQINAWEARLADAGTILIKCNLHITADDQRERLGARLDDPSKHWKRNPGDLDVRARWPDYRAACADALERCNTDAAPWYVIPAGRKWYRNWAVAALAS